MGESRSLFHSQVWWSELVTSQFLWPLTSSLLPPPCVLEKVRYLLFIFCLGAAQFQAGLFDIQQQDEDVTVAVESSNKLLQGEVDRHDVTISPRLVAMWSTEYFVCGYQKKLL